MKNSYLLDMETPNPMVMVASGVVQYTEYESREPERFGPIERKVTLGIRKRLWRLLSISYSLSA